MKRLLFAPLIACAMLLQACLGTTIGAPPQLPSQWANNVRSAVSFAFNSFDAALYGVDAMIAFGKLVPGSPTAKRVAAAGRKVQAGLNAAEAARRVGNSASYEAAFAQANAALTEFRSLIGRSPSASLHGPPMSAAQRTAILDRLDA